MIKTNQEPLRLNFTN